MICEECKSSFQTLKGLHLHVGKSHYSLQEYYSKHFPRMDLTSGEPIVFKDVEDYFEKDFNSKENFALWCSKNESKRVQEYILNMFLKRAKKKQTNRVPSHLELKSLFLPSWFGLISIFKTKENVVNSLSSVLELKFDYINNPKFDNKEPEIIIDTREQFPLSFPNSKKMKLSCGDYSTTGELFSDVFIERKSLNDLASTLSSGKERFLKEIDRAKKLNYYLVVVVEDEFNKTLNWGPTNSFSRIANGKYLFFTIRNILNNSNNIQFVFSGSRQNSLKIIPKIFQMKGEVRNFDLEYLKDFNLL